MVRPHEPGYSETFLRTLAARLASHVADGLPPKLDGSLVVADGPAARLVSRLVGRVAGDRNWYNTRAYLKILASCRPRVVLAQFGPTGVGVLPACRKMSVPLVVHFRGADATERSLVEAYRSDYQQLFQYSAALVAVSNLIRDRLVELGAPASKIHVIPSGADGSLFRGTRPELAGVEFVAVGRFVEKKAPYLTLLAFAQVATNHPGARLTMIGDGPLLPICRDMAAALGLSGRVEFSGSVGHDAVRTIMNRSRVFVQHSIEASTGDCEGMPVAVQEAMMMGLPVVATRHAGIADAVVDGETGFLVNERDVAGMSQGMSRLAADPMLAGRMGARGRRRALAEYSVDVSVARLSDLIVSVLSARAREA